MAKTMRKTAPVVKSLAEARRDTTRQSILAAARRLFALNGVRATSMAQVASELGIGRAALYYYFPSKNDIVREAVLAVLRGADASEPLPSSLTAKQVLEIFHERRMRQIEQDGPDSLRIYYAVIFDRATEPEIAEAITKALYTVSETLIGILREERRRKGLRGQIDLVMATRLHISAIMGLDQLWLRADESFDLRRAYRHAIDVFLQSVGLEFNYKGDSHGS